jgi:dTDP-4-dehydrorhamnose reductase
VNRPLATLQADQLPLLVTGISGVAGYNALHYFQHRYPGQVIGIRPRRTWGLRGDGIVALDAEDHVGVRRLFETYGFRSVLNSVGNCALKSCELDPAMAYRLNVETVAIIRENVKRCGARLVHLSSDLVYSGDGQGNYVETDMVDPVTVYGKTMAQAETLLESFAPGAAVLRISLPMGKSFNRHAGAIDWIQSRFRHGLPATLYFDEVRSCTYCEDLNRVFERFLAGDERGIYHLGAPEARTLYQIGQVVNRVGGYDARLLRGCPRHEAGPMPPRAGNVSMNSDKLCVLLGENPFSTWPASSTLVPEHINWHFDRLHPPGSVERIARELYRYSSISAPIMSLTS